MVFTSLSVEMQNLLIVSFEFFLKLLLLCSLIGISWFYGKNLDLKKKSAFFGVHLFKMGVKIASYVIIFFSPLLLFFLSPQISLEVVIQIMIWIYSVLFVFFGIVGLVNVPLYGFSFLKDLVPMDERFTRVGKEVNRKLGLDK